MDDNQKALVALATAVIVYTLLENRLSFVAWRDWFRANLLQTDVDALRTKLRTAEGLEKPVDSIHGITLESER